MDNEPIPPGPAFDPVSRLTLRQQLSARILLGVFQGTFTSGERLVVQRLAEMYQVSPTPLREALVELAGFGMVDLLPNRGAVVLPFGPEQVREISQVRRVLEVEATRCACGRIGPDELASLGAGLERLRTMPRTHGRDYTSREIDTALHGLIARSCGSARLTAEVNRYLTLFRTLRDVCHSRDAVTGYAHSDDVPEHLAIVGRLSSGDADGAADAMDVHIRAAARSLEAVLFPADTSPPRKAPKKNRLMAED